MLIFSILSLPVFYLIIKKDVCKKDAIIFFLGVIISSLVSVLFWSVGTFVSFYSDDLINKLLKSLVVCFIPILILFLYISISNNVKKSSSNYILSFSAGYLYFNMLFLIINKPTLYNLSIILNPLMYILIFGFFYIINQNIFIFHNLIFKNIITIILSVFLYLIYVFAFISSVLLLVYIVLFALFYLILKYNIGGIKNKIFVK